MAEQDPDEGMEIARVTLIYTLQPDGTHLVTAEAEDNSGDTPPLITMLGMLELSKDSLFALARGDLDGLADPGDDDEEDEDDGRE